MKRIKYRCSIMIDCNETDMLDKIYLTKQEFDRQLSFMRKQVEETKTYEDYMRLEEHDIEKDFDTYTLKQYRFDQSTTSTYLTILTVKDGYTFTRK